MGEKNGEKLIGIIGAMKPEIEAVQAKIECAESAKIAGTEYLCGKLYGQRIVAAVSGVGKVFSAICAQTMILKFKPDEIIHMGIGGSLIPELKIGDLAIADRVAQHDIDTSAVGDPVGMISGIEKVYLPCCERIAKRMEHCARELGVHFVRGVIASGDQFVCSAERKRWIHRQFGGIVSEMEGGSVGQVCYVNGVDFCVIRGISDLSDADSGVDYAAAKQAACDVALRVLERYIR